MLDSVPGAACLILIRQQMEERASGWMFVHLDGADFLMGVDGVQWLAHLLHPHPNLNHIFAT